MDRAAKYACFLVLISKWKACQTVLDGLGFIKRETKSQSSLDVRIARLSWVENSNKKYKQVIIHCHFLFCYFKAGLHLARAIMALARSDRRPDFQRKYKVMQQIILIYPVLGLILSFCFPFKKP